MIGVQPKTEELKKTKVVKIFLKTTKLLKTKVVKIFLRLQNLFLVQKKLLKT